MTVTAALYAETVRSALQRKYGPLRNAAKIIGRATGVSHRTAQNWMDGTCAPRGAELIRLVASCDELADDINRLIKEAKCSNR